VALLQVSQGAASQVALNSTDEETVEQCPRPLIRGGKDWCSHEGSTYREMDCDGDSIPDPYCVDIYGRSGFIASSQSCKRTWPTGQCQGQPCIRPKRWCTHSRSTYALVDCDGDGIKDPFCEDTQKRTGFLSSAQSCKSTWPSGPCQAPNPPDATAAPTTQAPKLPAPTMPTPKLPAPTLAPSGAPGTFAADRPKSCCSLQPSIRMMWSEFSKTQSFIRNNSQHIPIVVPCGTEVLMDEDATGLSGLQVHGTLDFQDGVDILLKTSYVFVCGRFSIGSPSRAHQSKVEIILDTADSREMSWMGPRGQKNFGKGPFVTYGGFLYIRGSKCGSAVWARLQETVHPSADPEAQYDLKLRGAAVAWKPGDKLLIAPSGREASQHDSVVVVNNTNGSVRVKGPVSHTHLGGPAGTVATEVLTLSHNVIIRGADGCSPTCGHFMLAHTNHGHICGAAFTNLGQTATEGRYPLHIHLAGSSPGLVVKDNSLSFNHNRGVVLHGVSEMLVESNVCFKTRGHCFMTEDAVEQYNRIFRNWGFVDRGQSFGCKHSHDSTFKCPHRSDNNPQAFWISNPRNYFDGNIGISSWSFAFFTEARHVTGLTRRNYPAEWKKIGSNGRIKGSVPFLQFTNNEAHSSKGGVGNYPRHWFGRECIVYENFTAWRTHQAMAGHGGCWTLKGARLYNNYNGIRAFTSPINLEKCQISSNNQTVFNRGKRYPSCPAVIRFATRTSFSWLKKMVRADNYTKQWVRDHGKYEWEQLGGFMGPFE